MTKDEALKMAIEALDDKELANYEMVQKAWLACKEALEQQDQEPVAYNFEGVLFFANEASHYMKDTALPLYTHPAKTLSDDEIRECLSKAMVKSKSDNFMFDFARAIEKKVRGE